MDVQLFVCSINAWCTDNQLELNAKICSVLHLGKNNPNFNYFLDIALLDSTKLVKDLGIYVDQMLTFREHIAKITAKARSRCAIFQKAFVTRDYTLMKNFFTIYVRLILEYGGVVWASVSVAGIAKLKGVQRYFSKKIQGLGNMTISSAISSSRS